MKIKRFEKYSEVEIRFHLQGGPKRGKSYFIALINTAGNIVSVYRSKFKNRQSQRSKKRPGGYHIFLVCNRERNYDLKTSRFETRCLRMLEFSQDNQQLRNVPQFRDACIIKTPPYGSEQRQWLENEVERTSLQDQIRNLVKFEDLKILADLMQEARLGAITNNSAPLFSDPIEGFESCVAEASNEILKQVLALLLVT